MFWPYMEAILYFSLAKVAHKLVFMTKFLSEIVTLKVSLCLKFRLHWMAFISLLTLWFLPCCDTAGSKLQAYTLSFCLLLNLFLLNAITRGSHSVPIISDSFLTIDFQTAHLYFSTSTENKKECIDFSTKGMNTVNTYIYLLMSRSSVTLCSRWRAHY